jgi:glycosyltransferase involved in cell wall biosynthesis
VGVTLRVVGKPRYARDDLFVRRRILELGLADAVAFAGVLPPAGVREEYERADVLCLPSRSEGLPMVVLEAMACGLPVVANAAGALPEVVGSDGHAGRLVPPRDPRAMAQALGEVLADPARAAAMGRAARARVERSFRWSDAAAELIEVFEETRRAAHRRPRAA